MSGVKVAQLRLESQLLARQRFAKPADVVRWFGAIQAQDYLGALWALGLRTREATEATIQAALDDGSVLRTHVFRGTWQYVVPGDARWMLELVGKRVIAASASRFRELGLDAKTLERSCELFADALAGDKALTRTELAAVLTRRRIESRGRLMHVLGYAELRGVLCSGARRGKQSTYALLSERAKKAPSFARERALAELTERYFRSRGPATERDFAWWTGLPLGDVRAAIEHAGRKLRAETLGGQRYYLVDDGPGRHPSSTHLLPSFDECMIAYADRREFIDAANVRAVNAGGGMLRPTLLHDGRVLGTWQRTLEKRSVVVTLKPFRKLTTRERDAFAAAADRYARFLALPLRLMG